MPFRWVPGHERACRMPPIPLYLMSNYQDILRSGDRRLPVLLKDSVHALEHEGIDGRAQCPQGPFHDNAAPIDKEWKGDLVNFDWYKFFSTSQRSGHV